MGDCPGGGVIGHRRGYMTAMKTSDLLVDAFERIQQNVHGAIEGLGEDQLAHRPNNTGNSIAWLVWHLARVQDDHIADVAGTEQRWTANGWFEKFGLPVAKSATGYGDSSEQVSAVKVPADLLGAYMDDVHEATVAYLKTLGESDYERVVDDRWDPPVTLGARLVSVIDDDAQHSGQAAYVRGLLQP